tara:strand:- start:66500 stop:69556 length:3057 start_codon:yes stop_codon:yes gene_type:complete
MKKKLFIYLLLFSSFGFGQVSINWQKSYGGSLDDIANSIKPTSDGGIIVVGQSKSSDGDVNVNSGENDYWVTKLDSAGYIIWQNSFGGSGHDVAESIQQTTDNGYIIAGNSNSTDGDITGNNGSFDRWIVKLDASGNLSWQKSLGGAGNDYGSSIKQTNDGGYIVAGKSSSSNGDVSGNNGGFDYWVTKLDAFGNISWEKSFGGSFDDWAYSIQQTLNGYIVAGFSGSIDGDVSGNNGNRDYWIISLDLNGNIIWQKSLGGSGDDRAYSIQQTADGGYIVVGESDSSDGDVTINNGGDDFWIVKLDAFGNISWEKSFGGSGNDRAYSVIQTLDEGYFIVGYTTSNDGNVTQYSGNGDCWMLKLDEAGNFNWQKSLGGTLREAGLSIQLKTNGKYLISGYSESNDGNVLSNNGELDFWILELNTHKIFGNCFNDVNENCIIETTEPGLSGFPLQISPGGFIAEVDTLGVWFLDSLPIGTYTATIDTTNLNWFSTCPISQSFTVTDPQAYTLGPDFGMVNNNPCSSPVISIYSPFLRRCFSDQVVYVQACNDITATGALNGAYADVELDSLLTPTMSSIPFTALGNDVYRFELDTINPGQCVDFSINTTVSCDAMLTQTLCMNAKLYPVDSCALDSIPTDPLPPNYGNDPNLVMPQPCTLPWDKSSLQVEGWCQGDSVQFSITNTGDVGDGDMDCYSPVFLYINDTLVSIDSVQLQGQETIYYSYPANGETWILAAEQHPLHPGNSHPNAHVELCGSDSTQWIPDMINNQPLDDADPVDDIYCGIVTGSYDPNDKRGFPSGVTSQHHIQPNQQLQYVIRFQNTGTDTAFTVVIRDTLDTDLNIFTVNSGVSSHDYSFNKYGPRVLEWTFDNIMLPDSTTDEPGSNGFVTFTVDQLPNLPNGTVINNQADIYFDFNAPIITNQTTHRVNEMITSSPLQVDEIVSTDGNLITVYPNPNNGLLFIELEEYLEPIDYQITNINGRIVSAGKLSHQKTAVDIQKLSSGLYLIHIGDNAPIKIIMK